MQKALDTYADSLRHFTAVNEREGIGNATNNLADVLMLLAEPAKAERGYRAASARYREVGMKTWEAAGLGDIAGALRKLRQRLLARAESARACGDKNARATLAAVAAEAWRSGYRRIARRAGAR